MIEASPLHITPEILSLIALLAMGPSDRIFLVIDQFEEIFTLAKGEHEILRFDALLDGALAAADCPLYLARRFGLASALRLQCNFG
jgi:hypothetical protein